MEINNLNLGSANPCKKDWAFLFTNLLIVVVYGCVLFTSSFNYAQRQYTASLVEKKEYQINSTTMQKAVISLSDKRIDLKSDLPCVQAKCGELVELALSHKNGSNSLLRHKKEIIRYLGTDFYNEVSKIPPDIRITKIKTIVTFGKFYSQTKLIDVNLYTTFSILDNENNQKEGFVQSSEKYSLTKHKSVSFRIDYFG